MWSDLFWSVFTWSDMIWAGLMWFELVWCGLSWSDLFWHGHGHGHGLSCSDMVMVLTCSDVVWSVLMWYILFWRGLTTCSETSENCPKWFAIPKISGFKKHVSTRLGRWVTPWSSPWPCTARIGCSCHSGPSDASGNSPKWFALPKTKGLKNASLAGLEDELLHKVLLGLLQSVQAVLALQVHLSPLEMVQNDSPYPKTWC